MTNKERIDRREERSRARREHKELMAERAAKHERWMIRHQQQQLLAVRKWEHELLLFKALLCDQLLDALALANTNEAYQPGEVARFLSLRDYLAEGQALVDERNAELIATFPQLGDTKTTGLNPDPSESCTDSPAVNVDAKNKTPARTKTK